MQKPHNDSSPTLYRQANGELSRRHRGSHCKVVRGTRPLMFNVPQRLLSSRYKYPLLSPLHLNSSSNSLNNNHNNQQSLHHLQQLPTTTSTSNNQPNQQPSTCVSPPSPLPLSLALPLPLLTVRPSSSLVASSESTRSVLVTPKSRSAWDHGQLPVSLPSAPGSEPRWVSSAVVRTPPPSTATCSPRRR